VTSLSIGTLDAVVLFPALAVTSRLIGTLDAVVFFRALVESWFS
jgi:hypothetical protein